MKLILSEKVEEKILTRIEYLNHQKLQYSFIMNEVLRKRSQYKYDKENVDYYMEKFSKINSEFMFLSNEIVSSIDKKYLNNRKYLIEYDFEEGVIKIYEN